MPRRVPRGVRNNNPGNIEKGQDWQGRAVPENMTPEQRAEHRFEVFVSAEYGIRALLRLLTNYQLKHKRMTVRAMINRWAPPNENDTGAYVDAVARHVGVDPDVPISMGDRDTARRMAEAIIAHENAGYRYADFVMDRALDLAGIT